MRICRPLLPLLFFFLCVGAAFGKGYQITIDVKGAADSTALIAMYSGENKYVLDTALLDAKGHGVFAKPKLLDGGMYLIVVGRMALCDFVISNENNQTFGISTDLQDPFNRLKFSGSPENEALTTYLKYKNSIIDKQEELRKKLQAKPTDTQTDSLNQESQVLRNRLSRYSDSVAQQHAGQMLAVLVNVLNVPEPPQLSIPKDDPKYDSLMYMNYYDYEKEHFFDRMDFSDERIARTPFFQSMLYYYFDKILLYQQADSLIPHVDRVIAKSNGNETMFRYLLSNLFNHYMTSKIMGQEGVTVHLAESYYLAGKADWESDKFRKEISDFVRRTKPTLLGSKAPDFKMETLSGQYEQLSSISAPYIILYFYEPSCGHCKVETPKVCQIYKKFRDKGVQAIGVYTQQNKQEWITYIAEQGLDWINVWDPNNLNNFRDNYNVYTTPQIYVLDKDKKVVGLRLDSENLEKMLTALTKEKK